MKTFDAWAWVEFFKGSPAGEKGRTMVEGEEVLSTPAVCLAEIKLKYLTEKHDPEERLRFIKSRTSIVVVDGEITEAAADLKLKHRLHMVDSIVLACAQSVEGQLVTGDKHFQNIPDVEMLE